MTGALLLRGDPAASLEAASKHYVDQQTAVGTPPGGPFLPLTGGTLTGNLTINKTTSLCGKHCEPVGCRTEYRTDFQRQHHRDRRGRS